MQLSNEQINEIQANWFLASVGNTAINFSLSSDLNRYHNGAVRNCTVYVRIANHRNVDGKDEFFLLYRRPKGYYVGHVLTAESGIGLLTTQRDKLTGKPIQPSRSILDELETQFSEMFFDRRKYDNLLHKRKK